jgi:hypothetical protein
MTTEQLLEQLNDIAAKLQEQSQSTLTALLSARLSDSLRSIDALQVRSLRTDPRSSGRERGASASQPSPPSRPPSALELLAGSKRLAPRIAAKLVVSEARRARNDRE